MSRRPYLALPMALLAADLRGQANALDADLARVRTAADAGEWSSARRQLLELHDQHRNSDAARGRRAAIVELHRRCAFHVEVPRPKPADLLSGRLLAWDADSGRIKIRYDLDALADFDAVDRSRSFANAGQKIHPMVFSGPHSITVRGKAYPPLGMNPASVRIFACMNTESAIDVDYGQRPLTLGNMQYYKPASIGLARGRKREVLDERRSSPVKPGRPFTCEVAVGESTIRALFNGRVVLNAAKPADSWGHAGFSLAGLTADATVTFEGKVERSWIENLVDLQLERARRTFDRTYDARASLPAWLFEVAEAAETPGRARSRTQALARGGPDWPQRHTHTSTHYEVATDIDQRTAFEAAQLLERVYTAYQSDLGWVERGPRPRFRVYLFSGRAGYEAWCARVLGSSLAHTAGLFSPELKQLLIWNLPERAAMLRTVCHEGFHQYLDSVMPRPPLWLNEGLAEYYEVGVRVDGRFRGGQRHDEHIRLLQARRADVVPLARFVFVEHDEFHRDAPLHYAQAWALVHFLREGPTTNRALFRTLFERLCDGVELREALRDVDLEALDRAFAEYLAGW